MLIISAFVIFVDLEARSNVIRFMMPLILLLFYYLKHIISLKIINIIRIILLILPFVFFFLAIFGLFNVFHMNEYIKGDFNYTKRAIDGKVYESSLIMDTRTFLYMEVLHSAEKYNSWLIGRSPAKGNYSDSFGSNDMNKRNERSANEVGILNVFTWTGIVGVAFYFFIFCSASFFAVNKSNNFYSKMLGLFVAFRWLFSWIEDINEFTLNYFILWLMIGLCFSKQFREMSNTDVRILVRGIFDKRY
jgi:hypothetical protein